MMAIATRWGGGAVGETRRHKHMFRWLYVTAGWVWVGGEYFYVDKYQTSGGSEKKND
jgi:hypothetical protein